MQYIFEKFINAPVCIKNKPFSDYKVCKVKSKALYQSPHKILRIDKIHEPF